MERIERPSHILYVDRDRFGSALCFYIACILLPLAWTAGSLPLIGHLLWALFAAFLVGAFRLLFRQRALVIDRDRSEVRFMDRGLFSGTRRRVLSPDQLTVWIVSELDPSQALELQARCGSIWILSDFDPSQAPELQPRRGPIVLGGSDRPGILFLSSTGKPNLVEWADRLAADLGCPSYLNLRPRAPGSETLTFQRTPQPHPDSIT